MPIAESLVDPVAVLEFDWFRIDVSGDFNWDVIFISAFISVNKNFLKGVRRLLSG